METPIKMCERCGEPIPRDPQRPPAYYRDRRFCSRSCAQKTIHPRTVRRKLCPVCGEEFEDSRRSRRKYCSDACSITGRFENRSGENHPSWKGGRIEHGGYVRVRVDGHYEMEHRLVMAEWLGRPLAPGERVHHRNGVRSDNRIENLQLMIGGHSAGGAYCCADCGSRRLMPESIEG